MFIIWGGCLCLVALAVALFFEIRAYYADRENRVLKKVSSIILITVCSFYAIMDVAFAAFPVPGEKMLWKVIFPFLHSCTVVVFIQIKRAMLLTAANGGEQKITEKGHNLIGYYVEAQPRLYSEEKRRIYCEKEVYTKLEIGAIYELYYMSNVYINLAVLEEYDGGRNP